VFIQDEKHVSVVTVGVNPPLVFRGEGSGTDEACNAAASAALDVLLPPTPQVSSVAMHNNFRLSSTEVLLFVIS